MVNSFEFFFFYNFKSKRKYATMPRVHVWTKLFHFAVSSFIIFLVKKYLISSLPQYLKRLLLWCDDPRSSIVIIWSLKRHALILCFFLEQNICPCNFFQWKNNDPSYWWVYDKILNIPFYLACYAVPSAAIELQNQ